MFSPFFVVHTVNCEIFAALRVGEFAFFQLAVDKILRLLCSRVEIFARFKFAFDSAFAKIGIYVPEAHCNEWSELNYCIIYYNLLGNMHLSRLCWRPII
jgi:hypothetical protein